MVVNLDECCFLGDIKAQDRLKGLITERSWTMEEVSVTSCGLL